MTKTSRLARNMAGGPNALSPVYKSEVPSEYHTVSVRELYRTSFMAMGWNTQNKRTKYVKYRTSVSQVLTTHASLIT